MCLHRLTNLLKERMLARARGTHDGSVDLLITGCEVSLWVGEQFASDLLLAFPRLKVVALSANKVLGQLGQSFPIPQVRAHRRAQGFVEPAPLRRRPRLGPPAVPCHPPLASMLAAIIFARDCTNLTSSVAGSLCVPIPYSQVPPGQTWFPVVRTYLEPATATGPLVSEVFTPSLLHFVA